MLKPITIQQLTDASQDATSLSEFMFKPAEDLVPRRLSPEIHTLNHYLVYFEALKSVFTQPTGNVVVDGVTIPSLSQKLADVDSVVNNNVATVDSAVATMQGVLNTVRSDASSAVDAAIDTISAANANTNGWVASLVADGSQTQAQINLFGAKKYDMPVNGYPLGATVVLDNGTKVRSTIALNKTNPNLSMTGWENVSVFKQPEPGAVIQSPDARAKNQQFITDYATPQDAMNVKRYAATYSYVPNSLYTITGALSLTGSHFIEGQGDYSVLKFEGAGNGIVCTAGSKYDDHAHRTIKDIRIMGDGRITGAVGTTTGLTVVNNGHAGEVHGVTFDGHDVGYFLSLNYTSRGCYNHYRANRIGLHLNGVTSYREESIYARYNKEAAVLITGSNQNITLSGGAIEGNRGARGIWVKDIPTNANMQLTLDDLYMEVNGNQDLGIPSVDIQAIEKMEVIVNAGSYWFNLSNGIYSGCFKWGNSVSFHGTSLQGYHYARKASFNNVLQVPVLNTAQSENVSRINGLTEPMIVTKYAPQSFTLSLFQVYMLNSNIPTVSGVSNTTSTTYPYASVGAGVTSTEVVDAAHGSTAMLAFSAAGNYNLNYASLFTTAHTTNNFMAYVFLIKAETDCEVGLVGSDGTTRDIAHFKLKAGKTYKMVRLINGVATKTERFRIFSIQATPCSLLFKPLAVMAFDDADICHKFADSLC